MQYWRLLGPGCAEEKEVEEEGRGAAGLFLQINQISSVTAGIHSIVERRGEEMWHYITQRSVGLIKKTESR
jgi:hypothetical protein